MQTSQRRDDGWFYGAVTYAPPNVGGAQGIVREGLSLNTGWFPASITRTPTQEDIAKLQDRMGKASICRPSDAFLSDAHLTSV